MILLANKANSATLHGILHPDGPDQTTTTFTEDEQRAFEQSTRGDSVGLLLLLALS